jgi:hypothetical protein
LRGHASQARGETSARCIIGENLTPEIERHCAAAKYSHFLQQAGMASNSFVFAAGKLCGELRWERHSPE